jgi:hypothetical protein
VIAFQRPQPLLSWLGRGDSATKRFSQTPPDKANELFDKLLATSDNAIKTRERLFTDLKEELTLLASLQEEHLFPVLRRHGMQELAREATSDNEATGALMAELELMPKNSRAFLDQMSELRRIFQQHIRDDRKELLPAVLKVLSDEETEAVAEKVEDETAAVEESKRAEARSNREQAEAIQRVTEDTADTLRPEWKVSNPWPTPCRRRWRTASVPPPK